MNYLFYYSKLFIYILFLQLSLTELELLNERGLIYLSAGDSIQGLMHVTHTLPLIPDL
jgi:hypothetical protein